MFAALIPLFSTLLDKLLPDPAAAAQAKLALMNMVQTGELAKLTQSANVITAEANSKFQLAAIWRPLIMLLFGAVIANNYLLAPYLQAMFGAHVTLPIPPEMWDLLKIGLGGYIVGRSGEKMVSAWKGTPSSRSTPSASSNPSAFISNGG